MKKLKMFGLAVVAAVALGAFFGAGSAAATEACKATESPCPETKMYKAGQEYHAVLKAGTVTTMTGALPVVCNKSTFRGSQENTGGATETLKIKGESLTFEECSVSGLCATATMTMNIQPTIEVHSETTPDNGIVTSKNFTTTAVCGGITCKYAGEVTTGLTLKGGNPATLVATKAPIPVEAESSEFWCGKKAEWDAEYEVTTPKPLWIDEGSVSATEACAATENPCSAANKYTAGQEYHAVLKAGTSASLTGALSIECKQSTFKGSQENGAGEPVEIVGEALTVEECSVSNLCATATVTMTVQPTLEIHLDGPGVDNGQVLTKGFTTTAVCGPITCKYTGEVNTGLTIKGGSPALLVATKAPFSVEAESSEFFCGKMGEWDATYEIGTPKPLWSV
jgi:hypothetical protein